MESNTDGIAVIGMAGRFPGAKNIDEFWANLLEGKETITYFTDEELAEKNMEFGKFKDDPNSVTHQWMPEQWIPNIGYGLKPHGML